MNRQPIYKQICEHLLRRIESGELRCGELLPSENELTRQFEVSRMTVRAALSELEKSGVIHCTHGKGREVCANHRPRSSEPVKPVAVFPFLPTVTGDDINYHNGILNGMGDSLLRYGLPVRYVSPSELKNRDRDFLMFFTPENYSGLIWINSNQPWVFDTVRLLPLLKIPYVMLNYILPPQMGCYAATDHFGGMEKITRHLLANGIRKIALLSADIRAYGYAQLRWEGFRRTMQDAGIPRDQYEIFILEEWVGEAALNVIHAALDWQPEALIIGGGSFAGQVFQELAARNLSVPGDISIAIFDRVSHPLHGYSDICCVSQPFEALGRAAVELLNAEMNGLIPENILIQTEFYPGKTVRNA